MWLIWATGWLKIWLAVYHSRHAWTTCSTRWCSSYGSGYSRGPQFVLLSKRYGASRRNHSQAKYPTAWEPRFFQTTWSSLGLTKLYSTWLSLLCTFLKSSVIQDMWPYCGHFQLHVQLWPLDQIGNHLTQLAIAKQWILSFQVLELEFRYKSHKSQSEDCLSLKLIT